MPDDERRHASRETRMALIEAVSRECGPSLRDLVQASDQADLVALAVSQGVAGRAAERLRPLLDDGPRDALDRRARRDAFRHMGLLGILGRLEPALEGSGLSWVVLKGPVLAELSYGFVPRGYSDLDILVPAHQLRDAVAAIVDIGGKVVEDNWSDLVRSGKGEILIGYDNNAIDLHWHLVSEGGARQRYLVPSDELLERRRRVQLASVTGTWALEPVDFNIHIALHAAFSGAHRLRWLVDIERTVAHQPPDWETLVKRCRAWRVGLPVSVALSRARETLGADVPLEVVHELAGTKFKRLVVSQLSEWVPSGSMPGGRSVRNGIARSLRDGLLATGTQFAGEAWQTIGDLVRPRLSGDNQALGVARKGSPNSAFGQEDFMAMVMKADRVGHLRYRDVRKLGTARPAGT
jgi:hypothetical protein